MNTHFYMPNQSDAFIDIRSLSKSYLEGGQQRQVLRDLTISFRRGEFTAILGKSGSGKSTLLNLLSGIDMPERGEIFVDGLNLTRLDERQRTLFRRQKIGFIFQFFNLIPTLMVGENVMLPLELNGTDARSAQQRAGEILETVGLQGRWKTFPDRLSGGEQQRVAIARALVHDPLIILADEPTGNLDDETGGQVLDLLDHLSRQAGKNLILVTHSPEAASFADCILRLHDGRLEPGVALPDPPKKS
jgi:putative ABC transport system ATP-binding protein